MLFPYISKVRNFGNKAKWLIEIAQKIKDDKNIPLTHEGLTGLKGIGSKSANVILREAGKPAEGVIVDLHVVRVAPRLGIATGADPKKIEKQIMEILPQHNGMLVWRCRFMAGKFAGPIRNAKYVL